MAVDSPIASTTTTSTTRTTTGSSNSNSSTVVLPPPPKLILLDVDNTLYRQEHLLVDQEGIEDQIVRGIHNVSASWFQLTASQADALHRQYGSTMEGIRQTQWNNPDHTPMSGPMQRFFLDQFYQSVYHNISVRGLLGLYPTTVDFSQSSTTTTTTSSSSSNTGYSPQAASLRDHAVALQYWQHWVHGSSSSSFLHPRRRHGGGPHFGLASNSPKHHVDKVVQALGLAHVMPHLQYCLTPDHCSSPAVASTTTIPGTATAKEKEKDGSGAIRTNNNNNTNNNEERVWYPTKTGSTNFVFFQSVLDRYSPHQVCLVDDSPSVCQQVQESLGFQVQHVSATQSLGQALCRAMGWIDPHFAWDDVSYLQLKNAHADRPALHTATWNAFLQHLVQAVPTSTPQEQEPQPLVLVDVGAGLLSFLEWLVPLSSHEPEANSSPKQPPNNNNDDDNTDETRWSLTRVLSLPQNQAVKDHLLEHGIVYYAYESNSHLAGPCAEKLVQLGFTQDTKEPTTTTTTHETIWNRPRQTKEQDENGSAVPPLQVRLRFRDFRDDDSVAPLPIIRPHAIVGCCFADLWHPHVLVTSLLRCFGERSWTSSNNTKKDSSSSVLVYFPITFSGTTQFLPPQPFVAASSGTAGAIPSDALAFDLYAKALCQNHGHSVQVHALIHEMQRYGATLLSQGTSDWTIPPFVSTTTKQDDQQDHEDPPENQELFHLWRCMMYFFGMTAAPSLHQAGFDAHAWLSRAYESKPTIYVSNKDLLFRMPLLGTPLSRNADPATKYSTALVEPFFQELVFTAPSTVTTRQIKSRELTETQVRIAGVCSLISSGTELKVFKGHFEDAALDVNIQGMQDDRMQYPLAYGYSLVGRVVECGTKVADRDTLVGKLVFAFAPHATLPVVDREAIQIVPDGIDPYDAIFLPSVETALSIVHDAHVRLGERVAIFGQGLIGLLVTAILGRHNIASQGSTIREPVLTTVDTIPARMAVSVAQGSSQCLFPSHVAQAGKFDVAIEVSGNPQALQMAIDQTKDFGRVVLASWYGNTPVELQLGMDFHRSHKTLVTSQVSELPSALSGTWTKHRRFQVAWDLVQQLQPSRFLLTKTASLADAQQVYTQLDEGREIAVAFDLRS